MLEIASQGLREAQDRWRVHGDARWVHWWRDRRTQLQWWEVYAS